MLAVFDPAAAILLFKRPNAGVAATAAIIVVDVIHNVWIQVGSHVAFKREVDQETLRSLFPSNYPDQ
jgi:hypothetical protein